MKLASDQKKDQSIFCRTCHGLSNAVYRLSLSFLVFEFSGGRSSTPPPPAVRRWFRPPTVRGLSIVGTDRGAHKMFVRQVHGPKELPTKSTDPIQSRGSFYTQMD